MPENNILTCAYVYVHIYLPVLHVPVQQPASSDSWRIVFFTMSGVLVVATLVFWMTGSGQRQWWAIYVEMIPAPGTDAPPTAAAVAGPDAGTAVSDENRKDGEQQPDGTKLDSARDIFASYMRQQQRQQQHQQQKQQQQHDEL